jgi:hypothetical protein
MPGRKTGFWVGGWGTGGVRTGHIPDRWSVRTGCVALLHGAGVSDFLYSLCAGEGELCAKQFSVVSFQLSVLGRPEFVDGR